MEWMIYVLFVLLFIAIIAHIFRVIFPHPRAKTSDSDVRIPFIGSVYKLKQSFYPPKELPTSSSEGKSESVSGDGYSDMAFRKPVIYVGRQIILESTEAGRRTLKLWDRDGYYLRYSVNKGHYPDNLVDGNSNTMAYPGSWFIDYIIDLGSRCMVKRIVLDWGAFGKDPKYITSWALYSQEKLPVDGEVDLEKEWSLVRSDKFPNEQVTSFYVDDLIAWRFRIMAESVDAEGRMLLNWIGIRRFQAFGEKVL